MSFWSKTVDFITGKGDVGFDDVLDSIKWRDVGKVAGTYFLARNAGSQSDIPNVGYQGSIPRYTAVRERVADTYDPNRRPGSGGRRYFTDMQYVDPYAPIETAVANDVTGAAADAAAETADTTTTPVSQDPSEQGLAALNVVRQLAARQGELLRQQNIDNPANQLRPAPLQFAAAPTGNTSPIMSRAPAQVIQDMPVPQQTQGLQGFVPRYANGGDVMAMRPPRIEDQAEPMSREELAATRRGRLAQDALEEALAMMESSPAGAGRKAVSRILQQLAPEGYAAASNGRESELEEGGLGALAILPTLLARRGVDLRKRPARNTPRYAAGGIANLAGGRYLTGASDGMADRVPANIDGRQEARLSDGEFVIPADVVSHLGNGNSNAGAQQLYNMMDSVRKARTGNSQQGKQIDPAKYLPGMR